MSFLTKICLLFAFVLPGILAGETAPVPDCGSFETVCCDGDDTEKVPSVGAVVHGCSQCASPLHGSPYPKQTKNHNRPPSNISIKTGRAKSVIFSSSLTDIYRQLAKLRNASIRRRGGAAVHSW